MHPFPLDSLQVVELAELDVGELFLEDAGPGGKQRLFLSLPHEGRAERQVLRLSGDDAFGVQVIDIVSRWPVLRLGIDNTRIRLSVDLESPTGDLGRVAPGRLVFMRGGSAHVEIDPGRSVGWNARTALSLRDFSPMSFTLPTIAFTRWSVGLLGEDGELRRLYGMDGVSGQKIAS